MKSIFAVPAKANSSLAMLKSTEITWLPTIHMTSAIKVILTFWGDKIAFLLGEVRKNCEIIDKHKSLESSLIFRFFLIFLDSWLIAGITSLLSLFFVPNF